MKYLFTSNLLAYIKKHSVFFTILFFSFFIVYPYHALFANIEFGDTFFFINRSLRNPIGGNPLDILTLWIGNKWSLLFGERLVSFRFLAILLSQLSFLIPTFIFYRGRKSLLFVSFLLFVSVSIAYKDIATIFGYDVTTVFFTVTVFALYIRYLQKNKSYLLLLIGTFIAFSVLARFPNIVTIGILFLLLFLQEFFLKEKKIQDAIRPFAKSFSLVFFSFLFSISFLTLLFFENPLNYLQALFATEVNETHTNVYLLFSRHILNLKDILKIFIGFFILLASYLTLEKKITTKLRIPFILFTFFVVCYAIVFLHSVYRFQIVLFLIMIFYLFYNFYKNKKEYTNFLVVLAVFCFSLLPSIGSDRGIYEQVAVVVYYPILLPLFFNNISFRFKSLTTSVLLAMMIGGVYYNLNNPFRTPKGTEKLDYKELKYARVGVNEKIIIDNILNKYNAIQEQGSTVVFYGARQLFSYLTEETSPVKLVYLATDVNLLNIDESLSLEEEKPYIIFINMNDSYDELAYNDLFISHEYSLIEEEEIDNISYFIYKPKNR